MERCLSAAASASLEFYCIAADTGRPVWGVRLPDNGASAPAYESGTLSFTTESCTLYVLDAASGKCLWAAWLGNSLIAAPPSPVTACWSAIRPPPAVSPAASSLPPAIFARASRFGKSGSTST